MKIDILLPIYNSPNDTRACIESVISMTPKESYTLYLLDDCSPDPEIKVLTDYFSKKYDNIVAHHNKENKGFPGNVNVGLGMTVNDVIILNSDTVVTNGWLNGLYEASVSQSKIGAVGPLSNYGMVTSVPSIYQEVNDTVNVDQILDFIKMNNKKVYSEAPVLIGFCMYMTRKALNEVGILDEETFKKGYGEEVDWCLRARKKGFKLIIAQDSYVFHKGGASFGEEKILLQQRNTEIINNRYKNYDNEIQNFERNHPLIELRNRMSRELGVSFLYRARYYLRRKKQLLKLFLSK